jgi:hypothetical protein
MNGRTKTQIAMKNKFLGIVKENIHRDGINDLLGWLETTDWYSAPASTVYHLNQEGGLLEHSINVYNRLCRLYKEEYGAEACDKHAETIAIVTLFHDVCKINCYHKCLKNVKVELPNGRSEWQEQEGYTWKEEFPYGFHGPKSVFLIERFLKLTPEEAIAIANHMGSYEKPNTFSNTKVYEQYPIAWLLYVADGSAAYIDEVKENSKY